MVVIAEFHCISNVDLVQMLKNVGLHCLAKHPLDPKPLGIYVLNINLTDINIVRGQILKPKVLSYCNRVDSYFHQSKVTSNHKSLMTNSLTAKMGHYSVVWQNKTK